MGKIQECETSFSEITMLMLVASPFPDKPISNQLQKSSFVQDVEDWPDFCCPRWAFLCHGEIGFWQRAWTGRDNELETKQNQVTIRYVLTRQETLPTVISTTCAFAWIQCKHAFASRALFPSSFHPVWFPSNVASKAWQISQKKAGFNGKIICKWTCSIATFDYYRRVWIKETLRFRLFRAEKKLQKIGIELWRSNLGDWTERTGCKKFNFFLHWEFREEKLEDTAMLFAFSWNQVCEVCWRKSI